MKVSDVMLPVGQTEDKLDRLRVVKVDKTQELAHSLVAVAHPRRAQEQRDASGIDSDFSWLLSVPAAGFVFVYVGCLCLLLVGCGSHLTTNASGACAANSKEVREDEKKLVLLVPSPGPLPSRNLLLGSIKWIE